MRYQLSSGELHQQQKRRQEAASSLPKISIYAVDLAIPANIGGLLRVADSVACTEVVFVSSKLTTVNARKVHRASRGADTTIVWSAKSHSEFIGDESTRQKSLVAVELTNDSRNLFETDLPRECAFVVGSERHGIPDDILNICDDAVHIPMYGINSSMNVVTALAVVLHYHRHKHH